MSRRRFSLINQNADVDLSGYLTADTTPVTITGDWTFPAGGFTVGATALTETKVGQWDTAYSWGDHSTAGYAPTASPTFTGATEVERLNIQSPTTAGHTAFNWTDLGENYLTHKTGAFTRFRSYDGVSTYTTIAEFSDSGLTIEGASGNLLHLKGASPQIYLQDTSTGEDDFWIHVNSNNFYILTDRTDSGSWGTPHPLQLEADTNTGYLFGAKMPVTSGTETISGAWTFSARPSFSSGVDIEGIVLEEASSRAGLLEINRDGANTYAGLSIYFSSTAQWQLMAGQNICGLYDDYNNKWGWIMYENSYLRLYNNGSIEVETHSDGMRRYNKGSFYHNESSSYLSGGVTFSTLAASGGSSGDIWYQYT